MRIGRMTRAAGLALALAMAGLSITATARAESARERLAKVAGAYKALGSYSDHGEFVIAMTLGGKAQKTARPLRLTLVRPNKVDLEAGPVRLTSDGKTITTVINPLKKYISAPAPEKIGVDTFREGPTGAVLFGGTSAAPTAAPMFVLLSLLSGVNPDVLLDQMGGKLIDKANPDAKGVPDLVIDLQEGPDLVIGVDAATGLLASIEMKMDAEQLKKSAPPGQELTIERFGWSSGAISTKVPADRSFAFTAPKDYAPIEAGKDAPAQKKAEYAVQERIGQPAPDFTMTLLDGPGKTRTVHKADLAGKVVLIDFWATWCGPCLMELPEIQKLIEHYKDAGKDVVVVALSQDERPEEISEVRKLVEKTLATKKITLEAGSVGRIGLDPSGSVGKAFDVEGFPTLVILDGKGIVRSAHVGYDPDAAEPLHKLLTKEIDGLLTK